MMIDTTGRVAGARAPAARFGLARAAAAAPAMFGSLLLVLVAAGGLGAWAPLVVVTWASCGAVALTRGGERAVVRVALGFRLPHPEQAAVLQPLWSTALRLAGTSADDVELYVQPGRQLNAYATGGRSVAVTSRALHDHRAGRLSGEQVVAVLVHELGHHATGATRPMVITLWLTAPWRVARRLQAGLTRRLSGRPSDRALTVPGAAVVVAAVVRSGQQGHWLAGGVIAAVALAAVICPLADAWACRRAEFAADRFAADHGCTVELADALHVLDDGLAAPAGWCRRLLASHPPVDLRINALLIAFGREAKSASPFWLPQQMSCRARGSGYSNRYSNAVRITADDHGRRRTRQAADQHKLH